MHMEPWLALSISNFALAGGSVGWSMVPYTKGCGGSIPSQGTYPRLQVRALAGVLMGRGGSQSMFISHIMFVFLSTSPPYFLSV